MALCIIELKDIKKFSKKDIKKACVSYRSNHYAWVFDKVKRIKPYHIKGKLGLFEI
jgi:hypothetical protein